jgi:excisionase family DNA binding protein
MHQFDASNDMSNDTLHKVTVAEAAERLGVTQDAVYKRIKRGTIRADTGADGSTYVYIDTLVDTFELSTDNPADSSYDAATDALIAALQDQIQTLKTKLDDWKAEAQRKDTIMTMAQRIPELEHAQGSRESPESASEDDGWERKKGVEG